MARLVLIDAAGYRQQALSVPIALRLAATPVLAPLFAHMLPRSLVAASLRDVYGDPSLVTPALVDEYYDMASRAGNRQALAAKEARTHFEPLSDLDSVGHAADFNSVGRPRPAHYAGQRRPVRADIAGSTVVLFARLGHVPQEEDPAATLAAARAFLAEK